MHRASCLIQSGHVADGLRYAADVLDELPADQHNALLYEVARRVVAVRRRSDAEPRPAICETGWRYCPLGRLLAMADLKYDLLDADQARALAGEMQELYAEVYAEPPYEEGPEHVAQFRRRFRDQLRQSGFSLARAVDADAGRLVGAAYGHTMPAGEWMEPRVGEPPADLLDVPKLMIPEWMVRKPYRGRGVGRRLLGMLLDGRPEPYAILASNPAAPARRIYERMGWQQCGTIAPKLIPPMDVLVLPLPRSS
jgi:GNAT superfamily N-acetyltransferase